MKNKAIYVFVLVALVQLYVPAKMIWDREDIIKQGQVYKFKIAPIDPSDPFRGKYIDLRFDANIFEVRSAEEWNRNERVFVFLKEDTDGFAIIQDVQKEAPTNDQAYVEAEVDYVVQNQQKELFISYPFSRYYMEESKALEAELLYNRMINDTTKTVYAVVAIDKGKGVLKDVMVDGVRIEEAVGRQSEGASY